MAGLYALGYNGLVDESIDWENDDIRALLLGPSFVFDSAKQYRDEIDDAHVIGTSELLENASYEDRLASGIPFEFLQLTSSKLVSHAIVYKDTGDDAYSPLIAYYATEDLTGVPFAPAGLNYYLYPNVTGGFFQLTGDPEITGPINTFLLAGPWALVELDGGLSFSVPVVYIGGKLVVTTQAVCATPDEPDDCCEPTIRSDQCD